MLIKLMKSFYFYNEELSRYIYHKRMYCLLVKPSEVVFGI
ncbi:hypothetical protein ECH_0358 [Ehrlichia chaffeensis str. Arkansas]|uniref:Uncharacterized protein n=1 Tax=Ehrlichia chaffeensis (strain ATCC CRL-10679 / Arkansas) TaxID=205920 RepID=Q2GHA5_EHRCR|nr:hypothetical protein ECH_0358 [Ehrlichia chaffeensis str. Arkansas]